MSLCEIFPDDPSCPGVDPTPDQGDVDGGDDQGVDNVNDDGDSDMVDDDAGTDGDDQGMKKEMMEEEKSSAMKEGHGEGKYAMAAETAVEQWERVSDLKSFAGLSPLMDHLKLFMVASSWAAGSALLAFRYRSDSKFYHAGKIGSDTNWWQLADQVRLYGGLSVGSVLAVTSLMAMFGISNSLNMMAWRFFGLGSMLLGLTVWVIRFLGYEAAYGHSKSADATKMASGKQTMQALQSDGLVDAAVELGSMLTLASAKEGVAFAAWNALDASAQDDMISGWEQEISERVESIEDERAAEAEPSERSTRQKRSGSSGK